jgi:hypothetical protein
MALRIAGAQELTQRRKEIDPSNQFYMKEQPRAQNQETLHDLRALLVKRD